MGKPAIKQFVKLEGGPKDGEFVEYTRPLPNCLVITEVSGEAVKFGSGSGSGVSYRYYDYTRIPDSNIYRYRGRGPSIDGGGGRGPKGGVGE